MEFYFTHLSVQWIVATLCTTNTQHLQQVTIHSDIGVCRVQEANRREWQDLDHLLVQLWTSHSVIQKIVYTKVPEGMGITEAAQNLLPELMKRGAECKHQPL